MTQTTPTHVQPAPFGLDEDLLDASGVPLIAVHGELDLFTAPELRALLRAHVDGPGVARDLVVDLSDCSFVDASGCQVLLRAARRLAPLGRLLVAIVETGSPNARIFSVMGLDELFPVVPSRAAAGDALRRRAT